MPQTDLENFSNKNRLRDVKSCIKCGDLIDRTEFTRHFIVCQDTNIAPPDEVYDTFKSLL